jgi:hypothetical protein
MGQRRLHEFQVNLPGGGTSPATFCAMNDIANLYVSLKFDRSVIDPGNTFALEFDYDRDGIMEEGDDVFLLNPDFGFTDGYRTMLSPCPPGAICGLLDTDGGGTNDGAGAFVWDSLRPVVLGLAIGAGAALLAGRDQVNVKGRTGSDETASRSLPFRLT